MLPLMQTDSERLMHHGVETGVDTLVDFLKNSGWSIADIDRTICHQVGTAHQKLMLESLGINPEIDYSTFSWLGNTGSAALPITLASACEKEFIKPDQNVALLGIGSGINCMMLAVNWQKTLVKSSVWASGSTELKKPNAWSKKTESVEP